MSFIAVLVNIIAEKEPSNNNLSMYIVCDDQWAKVNAYKANGQVWPYL